MQGSPERGALGRRGHLSVTAALRSRGLLRAACLATTPPRPLPLPWEAGPQCSEAEAGLLDGVPVPGALPGCGRQGRLPMKRPAPRWTSPTRPECPRSRHRPIPSRHPQFPAQRRSQQTPAKADDRTKDSPVSPGSPTLPPQLVSCRRDMERALLPLSHTIDFHSF